MRGVCCRIPHDMRQNGCLSHHVKRSAVLRRHTYSGTHETRVLEQMLRGFICLLYKFRATFESLCGVRSSVHVISQHSQWASLHVFPSLP